MGRKFSRRFVASSNQTIEPPPDSVTTGQKRSRCARFVSFLFGKKHGANPVQPICEEQGVDRAPEAIKAGVPSRKPESVSKGFLCCFGRRKKHEDGPPVPVEDENLPLEMKVFSESPQQGTAEEPSAFSNAIANLKNHRHVGAIQPVSLSQFEISKERTQSVVPERRSTLPKEQAIDLRKVTVQGQWVRSVSEQQSEMMRMNEIRASTTRQRFVGVKEDILFLSKGLFLTEKKSNRREIRLREQLLRRDWQERARAAFIDFLETYTAAQYSLWKLKKLL